MNAPRKKRKRSGGKLKSLSLRPWLRQPRESQKAYAAFLEYRDMHRRSLARVADKTKHSETSVSDWSRKFSWVDRALAWDHHVREVEDAAREKAAKEAIERKARVGTSLVSLGYDQLGRLAKAASKKGEDQAILTAREALALVNDGTRLEAEALGITDGKKAEPRGTDPEVQRLIDRALEELDDELPHADGGGSSAADGDVIDMDVEAMIETGDT